MEILYADDLVIMAESIKEFKSILVSFKQAMEDKGLKVNIRKTKVMISSIESVQPPLESSVDPCAVCGKTIRNPIRCNLCMKWVHARWSGIRGSLSKHETSFN